MTNHSNTCLQPEALLLVASQCPHCHSLQQLLEKASAAGKVSELNVINIETSPQQARQYPVRSVPWLRLGQLEFSGAMTATELDQAIEQAANQPGNQDIIENRLLNGKITDVVDAIDSGAFRLSYLVPLLEKTDAKINVRIGIGAVLEHFEGTGQIKSIIPLLAGLTRHPSAVVRADACHYLALTHDNKANEILSGLLNDEDAEVREIVRESLGNL